MNFIQYLIEGRNLDGKEKTNNTRDRGQKLNLDELLKRATQAVEKGRYRDAITDLEIVTEMVPEHSEAWNNLGVANLLVGDMEQAEKAFRSGLEQDPENPQMVKNLIQTLLQMDPESGRGNEFAGKVHSAPTI